MDFISSTLSDLVPFFDYQAFIPSDVEASTTFKTFNAELPGINKERVLDGYNIRSMADPAVTTPDR